MSIAFWRIAMRPGKPMLHGRLGAMRVVGVPGNPVSSYVCTMLFVVPLIRALSGASIIHHRREQAELEAQLREVARERSGSVEFPYVTSVYVSRAA